MDEKDISQMTDEELKEFIKNFYARIAESSCQRGCCAGCCGASETENELPYDQKELADIPPDSDLGLGCGHPLLYAELKEGQTVLDLGSGAGFDCFVASKKVGPTGQVIGIDMTLEMVKKARRNASLGKFSNVKFIQGEIEKLPLPDNSVDAVISNCVINLSPDKARVFCEAFRVLKPGGQMTISDVVLNEKLPDYLKKDLEAYAGCLSGASLREEYLRLIREAGFVEIKILEENPYFLEPISDSEQAEITNSNNRVLASSVLISARKPDKNENR